MPSSQESQEKLTFLKTHAGSWHLTQPIIRLSILFVGMQKSSPLLKSLYLGMRIWTFLARQLSPRVSTTKMTKLSARRRVHAKGEPSCTDCRVQVALRVDNPLCFLMLCGKTCCGSSIPSEGSQTPGSFRGLALLAKTIYTKSTSRWSMVCTCRKGNLRSSFLMHAPTESAIRYIICIRRANQKRNQSSTLPIQTDMIPDRPVILDRCLRILKI